MKKIMLFIISGLFFLLMESCAFHDGLTRNANVNSTEVLLSQNNFKVIKKVEGSSKATYILGIGGLTKKALVAQAREKMLDNVSFIGAPRAIIYEIVEVKRTFFPLVRKFSVHISGFVVEFY